MKASRHQSIKASRNQRRNHGVKERENERERERMKDKNLEAKDEGLFIDVLQARKSSTNAALSACKRSPFNWCGEGRKCRKCRKEGRKDVKEGRKDVKEGRT